MAKRVVRWNPFREMAAMQSAMDRMFDEMNRSMGSMGSMEPMTAGNWVPMDVQENDDIFLVEAELPGINPDDIDITLHENTLTISGETEREETKEGERRVISERNYGKFRRSVTLPTPVKADDVEANYEDGVLRLTLPKEETAKPRQISVRPRNLITSGE